MIPAFKDYAELIVEEIPQGIQKLGDVQMHHIISPLLKADIDVIEQYEKDAYANMVMEREDFENLIRYVHENQQGDKKISLERIREKYRELIHKSYEWHHNQGTIKKDSEMVVE